jgi:hypothetical protein
MSRDQDHPHFVYGTLRPTELAHRQIRDLVQRTEEATLHNWRLYVRDGLPFITKEPGHQVRGDLLFAVPGEEDTLSTRIADCADLTVVPTSRPDRLRSTGIRQQKVGTIPLLRRMTLVVGAGMWCRRSQRCRR